MSDSPRNDPHIIKFPTPNDTADIEAVPEDSEAPFDGQVDTQDNITVDETQMPNALVNRMLKTVGLGIAIIILSFVLMILERSFQYLVCTAIGVAFILWGLSYRRMFFSGQIEERAMRCVNLTESKVGNRLRVTFVDAEGSYHEFLLDKRVEAFSLNATYILYSKKGRPRDLICWQVI